MTASPTPSADALAEEGWVISSHSSGSGACVEVRRTLVVVAVRDSKNRSGGTLRFSTANWTAFMSAVKADTRNVT